MYTVEDWKDFRKFILMFTLKHPTFLYNSMMYGCSGIMLGWGHYITVSYKCKIYKAVSKDFGEEYLSELETALETNIFMKNNAA